MTENTSEKGIMIRAAVAKADTATGALSIDPKEIAREMRARIADMNYPTPQREREAASLVASYSSTIDELIRNGADLNSVRREAGQMFEACRRLTVPEKAPSFSDELHRMHEVFRQASWMPEEVDGLKWFFGAGGRISAVTITSVKIGDREILRSDVRNKLKGYMTNAQIDQCEKREQEALQHERANEARRAAGESTHHRQW